MVSCLCPTIRVTSYVQLESNEWLNGLAVIEQGPWKALMVCSSCNGLWVVDHYDKFQPRRIIRVEEENGWQEVDRLEAFKRLMVELNGGEIEEKCIRAECQENCLMGFHLCPDHLWKFGKRV